jgi:carbon-monoxide dehydrogenase medium subunit
MKPAAFDFVRPASIAEACAILREDGAAKVVAGCQSLGPMLNLRLAQPSQLVDITRITELTRIEEAADSLTVGACVTTADIEDGRVHMPELPILAAVAARVAYRAVRNRGTIGGSLCHADPAGDWLPLLAALGSECIVADGQTQRRIGVERFVTGAFETALAPGELLQAIRIPRPPTTARSGYYKVCRKAGEFALASAAVRFDAPSGLCRAVVGATDGRPILIEDARALFGGIPRAAETLRLDERAAADLLRGAGLKTPTALALHITALKRAATQALAQ